jgi:hypothetical protein
MKGITMKGNGSGGWRTAVVAREGAAARPGACRKLPGQLRGIRTAIFDESRGALESQEHLLELALNEAEALAAQTGYPHLVFPMLAVEKVRSIETWNARQQVVRRRNAGTTAGN